MPPKKKGKGKKGKKADSGWMPGFGTKGNALTTSANEAGSHMITCVRPIGNNNLEDQITGRPTMHLCDQGPT